MMARCAKLVRLQLCPVQDAAVTQSTGISGISCKMLKHTHTHTLECVHIIPKILCTTVSLLREWSASLRRGYKYTPTVSELP